MTKIKIYSGYNNLALVIHDITTRERRWSVQYELYIDIFYLINFMMDYIVLSLVKEITKCSTTQIRILFASIIGALLTCIIVVMPISYASIKFMLFHIVTNTTMIRIAFKVKGKREFIICFISMYLASILLSGVMQFFMQYLKIGSLYFALAIGSYWAVRGIWRFMRCYQREQSKWYEVEIYWNDQVVSVKALLDTGNSLTDPYTGQPVNIIEKQALEEMWTSETFVGARYIPYQSVGKSGVLLTLQMEKMHICGEREYWVQEPLVAISEKRISSGCEYQMILHPEML